MNLTPILTSGGQMLGHLNLDLCRRYRDSWVVDESAGRLEPYIGGTVSDTVRFFRFPIRGMRFRWDANEEKLVSYIITDETIPSWVWKVAGIKFNGVNDWERR